ncbi:OXA-1090 family carbapenem-hydrolyzing class D beta-lactamase [Hyphomonas sp.]|uniref:OXA-1090 family carbapenem-hydrolyzing class D beta-lactamase n=1 Tax=Hyphomonas sp. TaxID=87 RepID=UPI00391ADF72
MAGFLRKLLLGPVFLVFGLAACVSPAPAAGPVINPLSEALLAEGVDPAAAAFVVYRIEDEKTWMSGGARVFERFTPASISKIPHTLLALETGAVSGPDEVFVWDGTKRWADGWNETQDFAAAFQRSTVWIYQAVVPRIGAAQLTAGLQAFGYGNAEIGGPGQITRYWLEGPLAISAAEQAAFLSRLARRTLPLSARTFELAVPMMEAGRGEGWVMYAKSGWKSVPGEPEIGWYAGWIEQTGGPAPGTYVFVLNMNMDGTMEDASRRRPAVRRGLEMIGALAPG